MVKNPKQPTVSVYNHMTVLHLGKGTLCNCPINMKMHPILRFGAWVMHQIYLKDVHKSYIVYVFHYKDIQYCIDPLV